MKTTCAESCSFCTPPPMLETADDPLLSDERVMVEADDLLVHVQDVRGTEGRGVKEADDKSAGRRKRKTKAPQEVVEAHGAA